MEKFIKFAKLANLNIAMDSNSQTTTRHDVRTNSRGKLLEDFFANNQQHLINKDSARTTFQSSKVSSNIDLAIMNKKIQAAIKDWEITEEKGCSDHNSFFRRVSFFSGVFILQWGLDSSVGSNSSVGFILQWVSFFSGVSFFIGSHSSVGSSRVLTCFHSY